MNYLMRFKQMIILVVCALLMTTATFSISSGANNVESYNQDLPLVNEVSNIDIETATHGYFTENKGQWDPEIAFISNTPFGHVALGHNSVYFDFTEIKMDQNSEDVEVSGHILKLTF